MKKNCIQCYLQLLPLLAHRNYTVIRACIFPLSRQKKEKQRERSYFRAINPSCSRSQGFINMRGTTNRERSVVDETITRAEERVRGGEKESEILP